MQREEKTIIVLLSMALISLSIAYVAFAPGQPAKYSYESKKGDKVYLEGNVIEKQATRTGGHLTLTVQADEKIKVFISREKGAEEVGRIIEEGSRVRIIGTVGEYKGIREIIVESKNDVEVIN
jgi:DNA/RNA endonuclease YhcR with UshA esterase domain